MSSILAALEIILPADMSTYTKSLNNNWLTMRRGLTFFLAGNGTADKQWNWAIQLVSDKLLWRAFFVQIGASR